MRFVFTIIFVLLMLLAGLHNAYAFGSHREITTNEGLPSAFVKHITELPSGALAISTDDGLSFYDGYEFHNRSIPHGLPDGYIKHAIVTSENLLVVATDNGPAYTPLDNHKTIPDSFTSVPFKPEDNDPRIRKLFELEDGSILMAGQNRIYIIADDFTIEPLPFDFEPDFQTDFVRSYTFQKDRNGNILIPSTANGLLLIEKGTRHVQKVSVTGLSDNLMDIVASESTGPDGTEAFWIGSNDGLYYMEWDYESLQVRSSHWIEESRDIDIDALTILDKNSLFIGGNGDGLLLMDKQSRGVQQSRDFFSNYVKHIHIDRSENIWVATDHGINLMPVFPFENIGIDEGLPRRYVTRVIRDKYENLWVATHEGIFFREAGDEKLEKRDYLDGEFIKHLHYTPDGDVLTVFTLNTIHKIDVDTREASKVAELDPTMDIEFAVLQGANLFWMVDYSGLLYRYDLKRDTLRVFGSQEGITESLSGVTRSDNNTLWVSGSSRFVARYDPDSEEFISIDWDTYDAAPDPDTYFTYIHPGEGDFLWLGAMDGLYLIDSDPDNAAAGTHFCKFLDNQSIRWIQNHDNSTWVGTNQNLNWIYTRSDCDAGEQVIRTFTTVNGLLSTSFGHGAGYLDHDGYLWMGTNVGVSYYNQGSFLMKASPVHLRYWRVHDEIFFSTEERELDHDVSHMTFAFTTFDYPSDDIYYQSRLRGTGELWSEPTNHSVFNRSISGSGRYTFEVRASRNSTEWTEPLQVSFYIPPPWWQSNYMIAFYILVLILLIAGYINWRSRELKKRNKFLAVSVRERTEHLTKTVDRLEKEIQQRRKIEKQLKESNDTKEQLIKIISHDLRSPFQGIIGYAGMLRDEFFELPDEKKISMVNQITNSSSQALSLLTQLLDWVTLKSGKMNFEPVETSLSELVKETTELLHSFSESKDITIRDTIDDDLMVCTDRRMLQTVLRNLLTNAVKFTKPGGMVTIEADQGETATEIRIRDNGVGTKQEILDKILSKEKTVSTNGTEKESGTGLGLVMCVEMVERHGGTLKGLSQPGEGSTFTITLPHDDNQKGRSQDFHTTQKGLHSYS